MKSKAIIATIILLVVSMFATVISAQDNAGNQPNRQGEFLPVQGMFAELMRAATESTGLTVEEIAQQIRDGATLGEIITNNGGDVEAVIDSVLATISTRLQEQVDAERITQALAEQLVATAEQLLRDWLNNAAPFPRMGRGNNRPIGEQIEIGVFAEFVRVVTESTGLTVEEITQQMQDGASLAEVVEANGGDVNTIIQTVLDSLSTKAQEQVDAGNITSEQMSKLMETAEQRLTDWMNGDAPFPRLNNQPIRQRIEQGVIRELLRVVTETTGLTIQEITEQIRDGSTLAEVIEANGGDVDTITQSVLDSLSTKLQEQLDAGNITSEQMSNIMETAEQHLTDWMNGDAPLPHPKRQGNRQANGG